MGDSRFSKNVAVVVVIVWGLQEGQFWFSERFWCGREETETLNGREMKYSLNIISMVHKGSDSTGPHLLVFLSSLLSSKNSPWVFHLLHLLLLLLCNFVKKFNSRGTKQTNTVWGEMGISTPRWRRGTTRKGKRGRDGLKQMGHIPMEWWLVHHLMQQ